MTSAALIADCGIIMCIGFYIYNKLLIQMYFLLQLLIY